MSIAILQNKLQKIKQKNKEYDNNQQEYINMLHKLLKTLETLQNTDNINYAINQRLEWYKQYKNNN